MEEITEDRAEEGRKGVDKAVYTEELRVARDAIANLRSSFSDADPNQHILDTLEQCISVIVERLVEGGSKPGSRLGNTDLSDLGECGEQLQLPGFEMLSVLLPAGPAGAAVTKVVYFTPRSVTPFMSTIPKPVGAITLRDFKTLFDRPGFYRYHFKTMDKEFGMVKEEVSKLFLRVTIEILSDVKCGDFNRSHYFQIGEDEKVVPGVEGKIVVWVEEE